MAAFSALAPSHPPEYWRYRPEATLLCQVIGQYWPGFQAELARQVIARIEDPTVISKIRAHLDGNAASCRIVGLYRKRQPLSSFVMRLRQRP